MASSLLHSSCMLVSLSLLFLFFMNPSSASVSVKVNKVVVKLLCSMTGDPNLCVNILSSDPRTETANLQDLLGVSINLGLVNATDTSNYITSLLSHTTEPNLKLRLRLCSNNYVNVISSLDTVANRFKNRFYDDVRVLAGQTRNFLDRCTKTLKSPPKVESPLTQRNHIVDVLIDLIIVLAHQLEH